ncbi:MAG: T9SS type A sorting domain-containing protein [Prevotella sp.]
MFCNRLYVFACLTLFSTMALAQGRVRYSYDSAGNRIKREAVLPVQKSMAKRHQSLSDGLIIPDASPAFSINVYPNPTEGSLRVNIPGLKASDKCYFGVYTPQGVQIIKEHVESCDVYIDLSDQPQGVYLLKFSVNNTTTTWKVIKK